MSCGQPGRCCTGDTCQQDVGSCKCRTCSGGGDAWYADNNCAPGACWTVADGAYVCEVMNPCACTSAGGTFSGPGTACPTDGIGPAPPPPAPPPGEDPGVVLVYCCDNGSCTQRELNCEPGETKYYSAIQCAGNCRYTPPREPPPPLPVEPCDQPCTGCQTCVNGVCVSVCNTVCCGGTCCPAGQTCSGGICQPTAGCCYESGCSAPPQYTSPPCVGYWGTDQYTGLPCFRSSTPTTCVGGGSVGEVNPFP